MSSGSSPLRDKRLREKYWNQETQPILLSPYSAFICGFGSVGIIDNVVDIPMWELWKCWTKITWEAASVEETPDAAPEIYKLRKENMKINRLSQT